MNWIIKLMTSSIGKKLVMSLTGIFLCLFLIVHMLGNLQLFAGDGGLAFNEYAYFMTNNLLIKTVSYGLYFFILLHAFQGVMIWMYNRSASGGTKRYKGSNIKTPAGPSARNMMWLGILILAFIGLHMAQFWGKMKFGAWEGEWLDANGNKDLYKLVEQAFVDPVIVTIYLASLVALAAHLFHGFQSAFQTLGLNHKKYTPIIKILGAAYSILVPLGFAAMPVFFLFRSL